MRRKKTTNSRCWKKIELSILYVCGVGGKWKKMKDMKIKKNSSDIMREWILIQLKPPLPPFLVENFLFFHDFSFLVWFFFFSHLSCVMMLCYILCVFWFSFFVLFILYFLVFEHCEDSFLVIKNHQSPAADETRARIWLLHETEFELNCEEKHNISIIYTQKFHNIPRDFKPSISISSIFSI